MSCPKGKIQRDAYTRRNSKGNLIKVDKTCVPDKGKPGKTPESQKVLPEPGDLISLSKYGYSTSKGVQSRHDALIAATRDFDNLKILRRLNLLRNYQSDAAAKERMSDDVEFMKRTYARSKSRGSRKSSKKGSRRSRK